MCIAPTAAINLPTYEETELPLNLYIMRSGTNKLDIHGELPLNLYIMRSGTNKLDIHGQYSTEHVWLRARGSTFGVQRG